MKILLLCGIALLSLANAAHACISNETENNNNESNASGPICSDELVQGNIANRNDVDWFAFDVAQNGTVRVELEHHSSDDFDWDLFKQSGAAVASGATSNIPEIGNYNAAPGSYLLKVSRYSGRGWYDLKVSFPEESPNQPACTSYGNRPSKPANLSAFISGASVDVCPDLGTQGAVLLMGGGSDVNASFSQRILPHINGGDIVVLRTSGSDAYNDYLLGLTNANSVETLIVNSRDKANSAYVDWAVRSAEFVFVAGGDQSDYLNQWQGTTLQSALAHVYAKNGVIGGTSAGNAIQGEYIYDPDGVLGAISDEVVTDFCHETMNISTNFLNTPLLNNVITDTHFYERDRMGRMAVMLATIGMGKLALGVDEGTAMYIRENGDAQIDGAGMVYALTTDSQTDFRQTTCNSPVLLDDLLVFDLAQGDSFNIFSKQSSRIAYRLSINGANGRFYNPSNPY